MPDSKRRSRRQSNTKRPNTQRQGLVLIVVLVVVVMLSLGAYTFSALMITYDESSRLASRQVQARFMIDSAVASTRMFLALDRDTIEQQGGIFDNPQMFKAINIVADPTPKYRGNFTVLAPTFDADGNLAGVRYGLEDESTRINLNTILKLDELVPGTGRTLLMTIPNMTEEAADSILDFMDKDDEKREFGAETEYYSQLNPGYAAKNGPLDSIEDLLLVQGVTPQLLFGMDINRNGMIDAGESGNNTGGPVTSATQGAAPAQGNLANSAGAERGWASYLTLHSLERNVNSLGEKRIFVNGDDLEQLQTALNEVLENEEWVNYILAYRQFGPYTGSMEGQSAAGVQLDLSQEGKTKLTNILDLIGTKVQAMINNQPVILQSPFEDNPVAMETFLPIIMDNLTVSESETIPGRININLCSRNILPGIPGLDEEKVEQIAQERPNGTQQSEDKNMNFESWLLTKGIVTLEEMKTLSPMITARGSVYRAQIVGYFEGGSASARAEVIIDATKDIPQVLFWRDMSHLGRGYSLDMLGINSSAQELMQTQQ